MSTVAIIQARMGSTRLPGKVLAEVVGQPLLAYVVARAQAARTLDRVVVATSTASDDDRVAAFCAAHGVALFRGSEDDVLDRYYQAARQFGASTVVRLTADCPLLDPAVVDRVVGVFRAGDFDYVANTLQPTYPDGVNTEVFRFAALAAAWQDAVLKSEREHVTPYLYKRPDRFRLANVAYETDLSDLRWTVDHPQDLAFVRAVYDHLGKGLFGMKEVLDLLREQPALGALNAGFRRNEGYAQSLRDDGPAAGISPRSPGPD